jgi:pimeloyl-ACP methyl ester carboxylesterase
MSELLIEHDGVTLAGERAGEGAAIVLLHGLTATRRYVVMGSKLLERSGHGVLALDARGHGRSTAAPDPGAYGYGDLAADLLAVLDGAGIQRAMLVGASMGAHTALNLALAHPERVSALALITPAYLPETHGDPAPLARWDALSEGLRNGGVEGFVRAYGEPQVPESLRETVLKVLRQRLAAHEHPEAVADALRAVPRSRPFAGLEDLRAIEAPTLIVGSHDEADPGHPLAVAETYTRTIPGARLAVEEQGRSPLAWQGGQLSRLLLEHAERT